MKHITHAQFSRDEIETIFTLAEKCSQYFEFGVGFDPCFRDKSFGEKPEGYNYVLANVFQESSTRTRCSFDVAHQKLGGITTTLHLENSSQQKGESLEDTVKFLSQMADVIAVRHGNSKLDINTLTSHSNVPLINCGDGSNEHPTQALLDLFTIRKELGRMDNFSIMFVGDIKYARTIKSLWNLLIGCCEGVEITTESLYHHTMEENDWIDWRERLKVTDVLYVTRTQKERWPAGADGYWKDKGITISFAETRSMKKGAIVMHPGPRREEMNPAIFDEPNVAIMRQVKNGIYVRMALLKLLLGHI